MIAKSTELYSTSNIHPPKISASVTTYRLALAHEKRQSSYKIKWKPHLNVKQKDHPPSWKKKNVYDFQGKSLRKRKRKKTQREKEKNEKKNEKKKKKEKVKEEDKERKKRERDREKEWKWERER